MTTIEAEKNVHAAVNVNEIDQVVTIERRERIRGDEYRSASYVTLPLDCLSELISQLEKIG